MISRSPAVRTGVTPFDERTLLWLNSKSMFVVPWGSWTRDQYRFRKPLLVEPSWYTPKNFRSLLFGGMLPSTTDGMAVSSFVPWPKELSPPPEARSAWRFSVTLAQSMDGLASSCLRLASV